jgi:hypothetical protein
MKQKITIAFIFIFIQLISFAQRPTDLAPKAGAGNMNMGRYYGKIVDANKKGIDGATLQIKGTKYDPITKKTSETILGTQLSASNGDFSFENLPVMGNLKLVITAIGYKKIENTLSFNIKMGLLLIHISHSNPGGNFQLCPPPLPLPELGGRLALRLENSPTTSSYTISTISLYAPGETHSQMREINASCKNSNVQSTRAAGSLYDMQRVCTPYKAHGTCD